MTDERALLTLLQFADGLFPAGGSRIRSGSRPTSRMGGSVTARAWRRSSRRTSKARPVPPTPRPPRSRCAGRRGRTSDDWIDLDLRLDAMKSVPEFRAASRQMGRQTLRIAAGLGDDPFLGPAGRRGRRRACAWASRERVRRRRRARGRRPEPPPRRPTSIRPPSCSSARACG